jgi:hypothetical protein
LIKWRRTKEGRNLESEKSKELSTARQDKGISRKEIWFDVLMDKRREKPGMHQKFDEFMVGTI